MRVVAAAVLHRHRVLAARRASPPDLAGGWEFPGGKVEDGEDDATALAREIREELGVDVEVGGLLGEAREGDVHLLLYAARLQGDQPAAGGDHDELRWLDRAGLGEVAWLPLDQVLLPSVTDRVH